MNWYRNLILIGILLTIGANAHADEVKLKLSWDPVRFANAYKAQYQINRGDWVYAEVEETSVIFDVTLQEDDEVRAKVRGCFMPSTTCPEGTFSDTATLVYKPELPSTLEKPSNILLILIAIPR